MTWRTIGFACLVVVLLGVVAAPSLIAAADADPVASGHAAVDKEECNNVAAMGLLGVMTVVAVGLTTRKKKPRSR